MSINVSVNISMNMSVNVSVSVTLEMQVPSMYHVITMYYVLCPYTVCEYEPKLMKALGTWASTVLVILVIPVDL